MNEYERLRRQAIVLRDMYPPGTRVECLYMSDPFAPVPSGTKGTVFHVDDMAQIHVNWDNHNLTNLFRVMIFRPNAFKIELGFCHLNSRDFFEEWKRRIDTEDFKNPYFEEELKLTQVLYDFDVAKAVLEIQKRIENDCDLHRAATFLKLIRHSYSSSCKSFASQPFDITKLYDCIEQLAVRMNNAIVENQDFETLIKHYDREDSFSIPTHHFLFYPGNINAKDYEEALMVEPNEYQLIRFSSQGTCLYRCGNERYLLQVILPKYKSALFGKAGGR